MIYIYSVEVTALCADWVAIVAQIESEPSYDSARMVESVSSTCRLDGSPVQACSNKRLSFCVHPSDATMAVAAAPSATVIPQIETVVAVNIFYPVMSVRLERIEKWQRNATRTGKMGSVARNGEES